jgi:hypothetical protein
MILRYVNVFAVDFFPRLVYFYPVIRKNWYTLSLLIHLTMSNKCILVFQSIAEFLDGMPSFDERNFSRFHSDNGRSKRVPVYISTEDQPNDQS